MHIQIGRWRNTHTHTHTHTHKQTHIYCIGCDFSDYCPHLYCGELKHNVSAAVFSDLPQVSLVFLGIEMIQHRK